jgi:HSP20 family protein
MTLVRWEPVRELHSRQHEINRLFGSASDSPWPQRGGGGRRWIPAMDLVESDTEYLLRADLPGLGQDEVSIEVDDNVLTVSGERRSTHDQRGEGYFRIERASGTFARSLTLPKGVEADAISATFADGVLEVRIPKPEQRKPHRVAIVPAEAVGTDEASEPAVAAAA